MFEVLASMWRGRLRNVKGKQVHMTQQSKPDEMCSLLTAECLKTVPVYNPEAGTQFRL